MGYKRLKKIGVKCFCKLKHCDSYPKIRILQSVNMLKKMKMWAKGCEMMAHTTHIKRRRGFYVPPVKMMPL